MKQTNIKKTIIQQINPKIILKQKKYFIIILILNIKNQKLIQMK